MPATQKNKKVLVKTLKEILVYVFVLFLIFLTSLNINGYFTIKKTRVLAAETQSSTKDFWQDFLSNNQSYIPGWVEIGRIDKASQIDPNYFLK